MRRKLMKMGQSSLVVSVPAEFVKKFELTEKDEVDVQEIGNHIQIGLQPKFSRKEAIIDVSKFDYLIMRVLGALYKVGYGSFRMKYDEKRKQFRDLDYEEIKLIRKSIGSYSGIDLVDIKNTKQGNYVIAEQKAKILPQEFDKTFHQCFLHVKILAEEIYDSLNESDLSKREKITAYDDLINEATNFCTRVLCDVGYKEYEKTIYVYVMIESLEQIGDSYRDIYYQCVKRQVKTLSKPVLETFRSTLMLLDQVYHTYYKFSIKRINECAVMCQEIFQSIDKIMETEKGKGMDAKALLLLFDITSKVWDGLEDILAMNAENVVEN